MNLAVCITLSRKDSKLHCIQRIPRIPAGDIRKEFKRLIVNHRLVASHAFLHIINRPVKQRLDILFLKRIQFEDTGSGDQRSVHFKIRILRRSADQGDRTVLHERQKIILLSLIEPVYLVHEQDRLLLIHSKRFFRLMHYRLHILLPGHRGVDLGKF